MRLSIPQKLYRYQPYNDYTLDNLRNRRIWFSKPARFNDPFDCAINFDFTSTTRENWKILFEQYKKLLEGDDTEDAKIFADLYFKIEEPNDEFKYNVASTLGAIFRESLESEFLNGGIICFSEKLDEMLMWLHYSNGHRGFCLEFDTSYDPFSISHPVDYSETFPALNLSGDRKEIMWDLVTTKFIGWGYEKEWRLFHEEGDKMFGIAASSLTGIYLGCAMPNNHKETISKILRDSPTKIYESRVSETDFRVEFHPSQ